MESSWSLRMFGTVVLNSTADSNAKYVLDPGENAVAQPMETRYLPHCPDLRLAPFHRQVTLIRKFALQVRLSCLLIRKD